MQILYFDAVVVEVKKNLLLFRLALATLGFFFHFSSLYPAPYIVLAYLNFISEF